jgi:hypothetical protein
LKSVYINDIKVLVYQNDAAMEADIVTDDRGEPLSVMEPLVIGDAYACRAALTDLALDLTQKSAGLRRSLPPALLASLADIGQ